MQMAIPLYLTTIEQDIFDTFRRMPLQSVSAL